MIGDVAESPVASIPVSPQKRLHDTVAAAAAQQRHQTPDPTETGNAFLIEEDHWNAIHAALPQLPPRQREVIHMRLFEKKSPKEIAERLGCAESAIHMAQNKGIKNLKHIINKEDTISSDDQLEA